MTLRPWSIRTSASAASSFFLAFSLIGTAVAQESAPATLAATPSSVTASTEEQIDAAIMAKIRQEGMDRSQVMTTALYLTDVIGPRLTGSPGLRRSAEWARGKMMEWGLQNAAYEKWGPFGRGWELTRFNAQVTEPVNLPLIGVPKAWSPSLRRRLEAEAIFVDADTEASLEKFRGKLKGKVVLLGAIRPTAARFDPLASRWEDNALNELTGEAATATSSRPRTPPATTPRTLSLGRKLGFLREEGVSCVLEASTRGDGGTLFVQSATLATLAEAGGATTPAPGSPTPPPVRPRPWLKEAEGQMIPQVVVAAEHYNRVARMLQAGEKVRLSVELEARYVDNNSEMLVNTVAEIPGTDKADEVVMCGAHLDSWHGATGATDNAAGVAVCMEAVRILKSLGLQPRRTVRVALWSGEEQGLLGSVAYVQQHFGTLEAPRPDQEKVSAYFNLDNGTGRIRGVWCQGNAAVMPVFASWLKPFADLGATTVTLRSTGSTDHVPFDRAGIPGFQFIQDRIEYGTRTHHSSQDSFDRLQEGDLKQASVIMAAFLYNAAMREQKLPRKPASAAQPSREGTAATR